MEQENTTIDINQLLTFTLDNETFAIDISKIREVLEFSHITKVPQTPDVMKGVINLRGNVVPVIDMRLKFGMEEAEPTVNTCIIIMEIVFDGENIQIGALVDSVNEVLEINPELIEPPPKIGTHLKTEYILGMGKQEEKFIIILNIDKIFSQEEMSLMSQNSTDA